MAEYYWVGGTASWNGTATLKWAATSGGVASYITDPTAADNVHFDANSGAVTVTIVTADPACLNLDCTGFTGTLTGTTRTLSVAGNVTLVAGMTYTYTGTVKWTSTSTGKTITSAGKSFAAVTVDGVGGGWTIQDAFNSSSNVTVSNGAVTAAAAMTVTGAVTVSVGSIDLGAGSSFTHTFGTFIINGSGVRTVTMGDGETRLTGTGTVFNSATQTNLTFTKGSGTINLTANTASARTMNCATLTLNHVKVSAGSGTLNLSSLVCNDLIFTGQTGQLQANGHTVSGSLTLATGMTFSGATAFTLTSTSTGKTVTFAGLTSVNVQLTFNGVGGGWTLLDSVSTTNSVTLTAGALDVNGQTVACSAFAASGSTTRTLTLGAAAISCAATGTAWSLAVTTALTFSGGSATVKFTDTSSTSKTFASGGLTYGTVWFSGAGTGTNIITGSPTINTALKTDPGVGGKTVNFTGAITVTLAAGSVWQINGVLGSLTTCQSTNSTNWNLSCPSGVARANYLSLSRSQAAGGAPYFAGATSTNGGNNSGWVFTDSEVVLTDSVTTSDSVNKSLSRTFSESVSVTDTPQTNIQRTLSDSVTASDSKQVSGQITKTDTVTVTDSLTKSLQRVFLDTVTVVESLTITVGHTFIHIVSAVLPDRIVKSTELADKKTISLELED